MGGGGVLDNKYVSLEHIYFSYKKLSKLKPKFVLEDVSFKIPKNKFHIFIGENGAGKSTTMKILIGSIQNYSGQLLFRNKDIKQNYSSKIRICYIPDKAIFPNNINLFNYLYMTTNLVDPNKYKIQRYIHLLAKRYELIDHLKKNPNKLSAGQKKKVLLIQAILLKAELIILDEPAANLDPTTRLLFFNDLKKLQTNCKCTIFLSSHIIDEVSKYADYVTFIKQGKILLSTDVQYPEQVIEFYNKYYLDNKIQSVNNSINKNQKYYFIKNHVNNFLVCNLDFLNNILDQKDPKIFLEFCEDFKIYQQDLIIYQINQNNKIENTFYCCVQKIEILTASDSHINKDFDFIIDNFKDYEFVICLHLYKFRNKSDSKNCNISLDVKLIDFNFLDFRTINNETNFKIDLF